MSYRRSGSRSKRGQQAYLSNPKAIAHIARKVDEAIDLASQTGSVNSFADLKELVEAHSAETSKHPTGMGCAKWMVRFEDSGFICNLTSAKPSAVSIWLSKQVQRPSNQARSQTSGSRFPP